MATKTTAEKSAKLAQKIAPAKKAPIAKEEKKSNTHELFYSAGKGWGLRRKGSEKTIKYYKTKLEGVEAIVRISDNQKTSVSIRLKNGKFQKFDNAVRALNYVKVAGEEDEAEI
ncbi:MAG: DUF2188 domain-containing protein [Sphaerochaetaceae bacterium]|nr:DUF2188 domain-containing protein [Sphaerochaetaceae bacterium]